jgi:hypothetical protein
VDLKTKAEIILEFVQAKAEEEIFDDFFSYNDLGIPLSVAVFNELCELTTKGIDTLEETYLLLLTELAVEDINKEYNNLDEILEDSPLIDDEEE